MPKRLGASFCSDTAICKNNFQAVLNELQVAKQLHQLGQIRLLSRYEMSLQTDREVIDKETM